MGLITNSIDVIMKEILNDSDIFYPKIIIFNEIEWRNLEKVYLEGGKNIELNKIINKKLDEIKDNTNFKESDKKDAVILITHFKDILTNKPERSRQLFILFNKLAVVKPNLPSTTVLEEIGKVIENHQRPIVEQFILYKIEKGSTYVKKGLRKLLNYIRKLYDINMDILEIAFLVRKLNSLIYMLR